MFETSQQEAFCDAWKVLKYVFGRDSAPDATGGAHDARTDPLVGWGGGVGVFMAYGTAQCRTTCESRRETAQLFCSTFQATYDIHLALLMSILTTNVNIYTKSKFPVRRSSGYPEYYLT